MTPRLRYPKSAHGLKTDEISSVFRFKARARGHYFWIYGRPNGGAEARLAIQVSKKIARHAVDRNYIKRVVREQFRHQREGLPPMDLVVRTVKAFDRTGYLAARKDLEHQLKRLCQCPA